MDVESNSQQPERISVQEERELDADWRAQTIDKLAGNILEEAKLKQLVIAREQELLSRKRDLQTQRDEYYNFFSGLTEDAEEVRLNVTSFEQFCISQLEKRIAYLEERAHKLQSALTSFEQLTLEKPAETHILEDHNPNFAKNLVDILFENKMLEKYVHSENFRIYAETIGSLKYSLETLQAKRKELQEVRLAMEKSEEKKNNFLEKLKRKYASLAIDDREN
jgi:hypothetical protein